jgi:hypothetical protein
MEFENDWNLFVASKYQVIGMVNRKTTSFGNGWNMTTGQANIKSGNLRMWVQIRNFIKDKKKATVLFFATDDQQLNSIQQFMSRLQLNETPDISPTILSPDKNSVTYKPNDQIAGKPTAEVWMRTEPGAWNISGDHHTGNYYDLAKSKMTWRVVFPNGEMVNDLPREGLLYFSKSSPDASQYTWGRFSGKNGMANFKTPFETHDVVYKEKDVLQEQNSAFLYFKCKPVDGLRLNGSWSYIENSEKDPYYDEPGCRQVIYFSSDGRFSDHGVFVADCTQPNKYPEDAPGSGVYTISNYTLSLKYSGGRTKYLSFTGALRNDPAVNNDLIYIKGNPFFKRHK